MSAERPRLERRKKTLEELENERWGPPTYPSHLVTSCHRLRTKPIGELTVEELRLLIGQGIGLFFLIPLAIEALEREPLAEGDFYPGDLLRNVLSIDAVHWDRSPEQRRGVLAILERVGSIDADGEALLSEVSDAVRAFRERHGGTD